MNRRPLEDRVAAVTALDDPVRRALFALVSTSELPISRDDAASALSLARSTAAFHLDRLVEAGLLGVEFKRLGTRSGPGAGRPSKLYHRLESELAVSVPDRRYDLAAEIMASAIDESAGSGMPVTEALAVAARETGQRMGEAADSLEHVLEETGYEPHPDGAGGWDFANCPFHQLSRTHTATMCGINGRFLVGVLEGAADSGHRIEPTPPGSRCCARIASIAEIPENIQTTSS
ncbi:helix-turn-helix domain-containing protein [Salinibacterium sp. ZJ454]|uniref:helix-turn-helix transcriptional regulator n=1 Tax=Salinibacterium sp. ZJ454 TaxID=2708339 RepID=UPI0014217D69|nr:helix-turn-helix domain-containing protein [Salinibacterium sp. ZJ454]